MSVQTALVDAETQSPVLPELQDDVYLISAPKRLQVLNFLNAKMPVQTLALIAAEHNRITFLGRKVFNVLVCIAQRQGPNITNYRAKLSEAIVGCDFTSKNTEHLKETIASMVSTVVIWQSPTARETSWIASTLVAEVKIETSKGETWIEWSYSQFMQQAIHDAYLFAKINIEVQSKLKTYAGLALYCICYRYKGHPNRTPSYPWEWWRPVLTGKNADEAGKTFEEWKYFNRDVVSKGVREVNQVTDIKIAAVAASRGRTVSELYFTVAAETTVAKDKKPAEITPVSMEIYERTERLKITRKETDKLLSQYGEDTFILGLLSVESRHGKEPVRSGYAYLKQCLKNEAERNDELEKSSKQAIANTPTMPALGRTPRAVVPSATSRKAVFINEQLDAADRIWNSLSPSELMQLENDFEEAGFPGMVMTRMGAEKWAAKRSKMGPMLAGAFRAFLAKKHFGDDWNIPPEERQQ